MPIRHVPPTVLALLALASPAAAQSTAVGRATISVAEIVRLEVVEARDSVLLEIRSNSRWRVEAVLEDDDAGGSWSAGVVATGDPGRWRIALSPSRLAERAGAPAHAAPRFLLSPY